VSNARTGVLAAALILAGLGLWWRYGLLVVLSDPGWLCLPR